jgi:hypothetical protein
MRVTMTYSSKVDSPQEYFKKILEPNYNSFMGAPSTFQSAFNVALSLFHMRDWVYNMKRCELEKALGQKFATQAAFWRYIEINVPGAAFIRDVANSSKHVKLDQSASTSMTHVANVAIMTTGYSEGGYGEGSYGGAPELKIKDGSSDVSFDKCAQNTFKFWQTLIPKL